MSTSQEPPTLDTLNLKDKENDKSNNNTPEVKSLDFSPRPPSPIGDNEEPTAPTTSHPPPTENAKQVNGNVAASSRSPSSLPRPPPPQSITSAPAVPGAATASRPSGAMAGARAGVAGRGGMPMPMGMRGAAGRGGGQMQTKMLPSLQAKMDKIAASRQGPPGAQSPNGGLGPDPNATSMGALLRSQALRPQQQQQQQGSSSATPAGPNSGPFGLAARRAAGGGAGPPRPNLGMMGMGASSPAGLGRGAGVAGRRMGPPGGLTLSGMKGAPKEENSKFSDFKTIMDPSGSLRFSSKAVLTAKGVDFEDGASFKINMDEIEVLGELGKGNYGSVHKVFHRPTNVEMAMKEIRLELDESKLNGIIMELDILHRAVAPEIVEFFGAFTIESCVYYCMEYMDAGSLDTLTGAQERVPEDVLRRITAGMIRGLKFLKDELQIMHRDVKPTNVLINKKGEVKLCDFGVSGQLEKSLAKTNIGCQSYMAPERIKSETVNQNPTYTVSSDVWSVGLSIIELAKGCYPYPPETYSNVFAQLQAIVNGAAPTLPPGYSNDANDFVAKCLMKDPNQRPTYAQLLQHPFLIADKEAEVDMVGWVNAALERRAARGIATLNPIQA
uniref:mitogen-activated protein kinase kinase n=1 Tax=Kwoniella pini CBS 10737 TaxID=1296096 RepID=A0A1B9HUC1_9TREE|nr:STE/STE7 protein kinase [Kwoniella pini CBS 10737]OCF46860.1 STE/STE7 protein kinase [Kwoniella pini CBS 10737]